MVCSTWPQDLRLSLEVDVNIRSTYGQIRNDGRVPRARDFTSKVHYFGAENIKWIQILYQPVERYFSLKSWYVSIMSSSNAMQRMPSWLRNTRNKSWWRTSLESTLPQTCDAWRHATIERLPLQVGFWLYIEFSSLTRQLALKKVVNTITHNGRYTLAENAIAQNYPMLVMKRSEMKCVWPVLHDEVFSGEYEHYEAALLGGGHRRVVFCKDSTWVATYQVRPRLMFWSTTSSKQSS